MPQILKPSDVAQRFAGGETLEQIFLGPDGGYKAKLVGPEASATLSSEADRSIDFVISTEAVDRYTDIVNLGGWQTNNYVRNPVVLWSHDDSIPAIARGTNVRIEGKALRSTAVFAEREFHPLADTVYQLIKGKFISAASVGFMPLKAKAAPSGQGRPFGLDILEQELLEWSVVNIPANPECLTQARSAGVDTTPLIGWAERVLDKGGMLLIPRAELEALRKAAGAPMRIAATPKRQRSAPPARLQRSNPDWKCGAARDLAIVDDDSWDGAAAEAAIFSACGFDGDSPDTAKARKAFLAYDASDASKKGSYKLPFCKVVDGAFKASAAGIRAAASRLPNTDIPQSVKDSARDVLDGYEAKMSDDKAFSGRRVKSLWHVAWLADILMDLDCLGDCVAWEAGVEGDDSPIPQQLTDALHALGQTLVDMTVEEVNELLTGEDEEAAIGVIAPSVIGSSAHASRIKMLRMLCGMGDDEVVAHAIESMTLKRAGGLVDLLAAMTKSGKVLSATNEKKLRSAHACMTQACEHVLSVIDSNASDDDPDDQNEDDGTDDGDPDDPEKSAAARRRRLAKAHALVASLQPVS